MILGSHNSWSFLPVKKWWMKPIAFTARCQRNDIRWQYLINDVRCFDLRVRFDGNGLVTVAHGIMEYCYTAADIHRDLAWLNKMGDCCVRVIHEVRSARQYRSRDIHRFRSFCSTIEHDYKYIHFWCGRNLFCWGYDYHFSGAEPTCEERYASVSSPKFIDDWWPWLYARLHNRKILREGTDKEILLIDYVDIK